jgi:aerobic carbon-monoxide dehydrogenase small subunit
MTKVSLTVNGSVLNAEVEPRTHLADLLRETHNLTGTHIGCEHGVCGACTLLVDGVPIRSCITFAVACENAQVTTIEGLDEDEVAGELRAAFTVHHALQCGYCTPGMIVSARDIVLRMEAPTEHDIRVAMSGNLCRCTGYVGIVRAVQSVISDRRARGVAALPKGNRERLGPAGSGNAGEARAAIAAASASTSVRATQRAVDVGSSARVEADWKPQVQFRQSFVIAHPVNEVWAFFGRVEDVATCLPGASLEGGEKDGVVNGKMRVKVGPISAEFSGVAQITRDEAAHRGAIVGSGRDTRSNSATRGVVAYSVKPDEGSSSRVDVDVGYTLTGMLAQFGRSGLVQDIASRLTAAFAQNLEARLSAGSDAAAAPPLVRELNAGSLITAALLGNVKRFFGRFLRRS